MTNAVLLLNEAYSIRDNLSDDLQGVVQDLRFEVSSRMTRCAGKAWNSKSLVQLSLAFFADRHNYETKFHDTVLHELAHILIDRRIGFRQGHNKEWKAMAVRVGAKPERCHTMDLAEGFQSRKRTGGGTIPCSCCGQTIKLGPTQYKRHLAGYIGYRHKQCPVIRSEVTYEDLA